MSYREQKIALVADLVLEHGATDRICTREDATPAAEKIVDALALTDPVREVAREVVAAADASRYDGSVGTKQLALPGAIDALRAALADEPPVPWADYAQLREIRRSTPFGRLHDDLAANADVGNRLARRVQIAYYEAAGIKRRDQMHLSREHLRTALNRVMNESKREKEHDD